MPRVTFVKKARKDVRNSDIKAGESYYWWKFKTGGRGGAKHVSRTRPRQSQLTQSEFWSQMYAIQEEMADISAEAVEDLEEQVQALVDQIRALGDECQGKLDNMPEGLQQGDSGQMLQERIDGCEDMAGELESIDFSFEESEEKEEGESDSDFESRKDQELSDKISELVSEVQAVEYSGS